ncbi:MAG TPA: hypothetical protein VH589_06620 [Trebonia sp.]
MSSIKSGAIDCDVHVEPPSMDALLGYIDPYWHELIRSGHLGVGHRLYPVSEPMSARPEARAAGSFPPHTYQELRPAPRPVPAARRDTHVRRDIPGQPQPVLRGGDDDGCQQLDAG